MILEVIKAEYLNNYIIKLWFNNSEIKIVDLKDHISGKVFEPLKIQFFLKLLLLNLIQLSGKTEQILPLNFYMISVKQVELT